MSRDHKADKPPMTMQCKLSKSESKSGTRHSTGGVLAALNTVRSGLAISGKIFNGDYA